MWIQKRVEGYFCYSLSAWTINSVSTLIIRQSSETTFNLSCCERFIQILKLTFFTHKRYRFRLLIHLCNGIFCLAVGDILFLWNDSFLNQHMKKCVHNITLTFSVVIFCMTIQCKNIALKKKIHTFLKKIPSGDFDISLCIYLQRWQIKQMLSVVNTVSWV